MNVPQSALVGGDFLYQLASTMTVTGLFFWMLPRIFKRTFELRAEYAENLRLAGEIERATRMLANNTAWLKLSPRYGRGLAVFGIILLLLAYLKQV